MAVAVSILTCLVIVLAFVAAHQALTIRQLEDDLDHVHVTAHRAENFLFAHLAGEHIDIIKLRQDDKE